MAHRITSDSPDPICSWTDTKSLKTKAVDIRDLALRGARQALREQITRQLLSTVARAENLERLLAEVLSFHFPAPTAVEHTAGAGENGADIVIRVPNPFDPEEDALILLQLKDHDGETGPEGIEQLRHAIGFYGEGNTRQGRVVEAVLATSAAAFTHAVPLAANALEREKHVKVTLVTQSALLAIIADGLFEMTTRPAA